MGDALELLWSERRLELLEELQGHLAAVVCQGKPLTPDVAEACMKIAYKLLHLSDSDAATELALKILSEFRFVDGVDYDFWAHVYIDAIHWKTARSKATEAGAERDLHDWLVAHWDEFFGNGLRLVKREYRVGSGRVDFLAEDEHGPVLIECKKGPINLMALHQLQTYMHSAGIRRGILVGSELRVLLPDGITFIPHQGLYLKP